MISVFAVVAGLVTLVATVLLTVGIAILIDESLSEDRAALAVSMLLLGGLLFFALIALVAV